MNLRFYALGFGFLMLSACMPEELPVPKPQPGPVQQAGVDLGTTYAWQVYFDLETNRNVASVPRHSWDIGLACGENSFHAILNSGKLMAAASTGTKSFHDVNDTSGFAATRKWDNPNGHSDSTAIGDWRNGHVYIIDLGFDINGRSIGFYKIQLLEVNASAYRIKYGMLGSDDSTTLRIEKQAAYNFVFLSLALNSTVQVEPPKENWDLVFTSYTHIFKNPMEPYLVVGCLLNHHQTYAVREDKRTFDSLSANDIGLYKLLPDRNVIGYNWKYFNFAQGQFETLSHINYIIQDQHGYHYKLHFTDFYSSTGAKGHPVFEFQRL